jgi:hypothetical protein
MSESPQYQSLVSEHERLCRDLLPVEFVTSGIYPDNVITATIAYRLLSHAEIETYLEERASETALAAVKAWEDKRRASKTLLGLLAFSGQNIKSEPNTLDLSQPDKSGDWKDKIQLSKRLKNAINVFMHAIRNNNGIREDNIYCLLLPIGVELSDLDPILITDLDSFGVRRGEAAHTSSRKYRASQQVNPKDELDKVKSIILRLNTVDETINALLLEING